MMSANKDQERAEYSNHGDLYAQIIQMEVWTKFLFFGNINYNVKYENGFCLRVL